MNKRLKVSINLTKIDYIFEIVGVIGIMCLFAFPIYFLNDLPNQIPKHYNILGEVDALGDHRLIWLLPIIGLVLYIGLTFLSKYPFIFNYPTKVTNENAEKLYTLATRIIRLIKVVVILLFTFLNFKTIEIAINRPTNIEKFHLPIFLTILTILIGTMIYKMKKKQRN